MVIKYYVIDTDINENGTGRRRWIRHQRGDKVLGNLSRLVFCVDSEYGG